MDDVSGSSLTAIAPRSATLARSDGTGLEFDITDSEGEGDMFEDCMTRRPLRAIEEVDDIGEEVTFKAEPSDPLEADIESESKRRGVVKYWSINGVGNVWNMLLLGERWDL